MRKKTDTCSLDAKDRHVARPVPLGPHPDPASRNRSDLLSLRPFFLPFAGCERRCVFCDQAAATGVAPEEPREIPDRLDRFLMDLEARETPPFELGLFGGTFTRLPWEVQLAILDAAARRPGLVAAVRCSTRPDALDPDALSELRRRGLGMVELGIQSFDGRCLSASGRGYDGVTARRGCALVRAAGLKLGIQLMPGMPGWDAPSPDCPAGPSQLARDVAIALDQQPSAVRLYPCVVLRGTRLADDWRAGRFTPMPIDMTLRELAQALAACWKAGVPVIRVGLPPEPGMQDGLLAGPWLPDIGSRARGMALRAILGERLRERPAAPPVGNALHIPRRWLAEVVGPGGEGRDEMVRLGLRLAPWDEDEFAVSE